MDTTQLPEQKQQESITFTIVICGAFLQTNTFVASLGGKVTPKEVLNRVKLLFPNATMKTDETTGETIVNTNAQVIGEGMAERFIPLKNEDGTPIKPEKPPKE